MPLHPLLAVAALASFVALSASASAEGKPGDFEFYVLSLSWTPAACASGQASDEECDAPHGFLVHGFWPEYDRGYPDFCDSDLPQSVPRSVLESIADVMPSASFAGYQWRKHGLCSGLSAEHYFGQLRAAAKKIATPLMFQPGNIPGRTTPAKVEAAFVAANPGLSTSDMAVRCANNELTEVRICFGRSMALRSCPGIAADTCHASSIAITPIR